jgi:hypothetical protein
MENPNTDAMKDDNCCHDASNPLIDVQGKAGAGGRVNNTAAKDGNDNRGDNHNHREYGQRNERDGARVGDNLKNVGLDGRR